MRPIPFALLFWACLVFSSNWSAADGSSNQTKVAVVCDADHDAQAAADLLETHIGKEWGVVVVNRSDLPRILDEREMSLQCARLSSSASYLQADGLLLLSVINFGEKKMLVSRLVSRRTGVVLGTSHFPLPITDVQAYWTHNNERFGALIVKCTVEPDDVTLISQMNLYLPLESVEYSMIARQLSALITHRLMQERSVFLTERWRLKAVMTESSLGADDHAGLKAGQYQLTGNIEFDPNDKTTSGLEVVLRLTGSNGRELRVIGRGEKSSLDHLVDNLVGQLIVALGKKEEKLSFSKVAEAEAYRREAMWAYHAGRYQEACDAADSSYALGCTNAAVRELRTRAYACLAYPDAKWPIDPAFSSRQIAVNGGDENLEAAITSMELLQNSCERSMKLSDEASDWRVFSAHVVANAARVLRGYSATKPSGFRRDRLAYLRKMIRRTVDELMEQRDSPCYLYRVFSLLALYLPYWYDTPEDAVTAYKRLLSQRFIEQEHVESDIRLSLVDRAGVPFLVDWTQSYTRDDLSGIWERYVSSLVASPNLRDRLDGTWIRIHAASNEVARKKYIKTMTDLLWDNRETVFFGERPRVNTECPWTWVEPTAEKRQLQEALGHYALSESAKRNEELSLRVFGLLSAWIASDTGRDKVAGMYREYKAYIDKITPELRQKQRGSFHSYEDIFFRQYPELAGDATTNGCYLKAFHHPLGCKPNAGWKGFWLDGMLASPTEGWMMCLRRKPNSDSRVMYGVDVASGTQEEMILPNDFSNYDGFMNSDKVNHVELFAVSEFYLVAVDRKKEIYAYDRRSKQWRKLDAPKLYYSSLYVDGSDLYVAFSPVLGVAVGFSDSKGAGILKIDLNNGRVDVIASSSRSPGRSPLDSVNPYRTFFSSAGSDGLLIRADECPIAGAIVSAREKSSTVCIYGRSGNWDKVAEIAETMIGENGISLLAVSKIDRGKTGTRHFVVSGHVTGSRIKYNNPQYAVVQQFLTMNVVQQPLLDQNAGVCLAICDAGHYQYKLKAISLDDMSSVASVPFAVRRLGDEMESRILSERGFVQSFYMYTSPNLFASDRYYLVSSLCANGFWYAGKEEVLAMTKASKIEEASDVLAERNQSKTNITPSMASVPAAVTPGNANKPEVALVQNGLLLYYPFTDSPNSKVLDKSGSGHNGIASDVEWKPGRRGGMSAKFNGNSSYIETTIDEALASDADITISVWVRPQAKATGWESIAATEAFRIEICPDGIIHWDWTDKNNIYTEAGVISPDKWTHLAFVRKNRNLAIFVAGTQVFAMQNATSPQSIGTIQFGKSGIAKIGGEDFFTGYMDDVHVFTRALSNPEIKALSRE